MSGGSCSAVSHGQDRDRDRNDDDPPPQPTAAEIMMEAELNRRDQTRLLKLIVENTSHQ